MLLPTIPTEVQTSPNWSDYVPLFANVEVMMDDGEFAPIEILEGACRVSAFPGWPHWKMPRVHHHRIVEEIDGYTIKQLLKLDYRGTIVSINDSVSLLPGQSILVRREDTVLFANATDIVFGDVLYVPAVNEQIVEALEFVDIKETLYLLLPSSNSHIVSRSGSYRFVPGPVSGDFIDLQRFSVDRVPHMTVTIVKNFWKEYCKDAGHDCKVSIGTSQTGVKRGPNATSLYCRKEIAYHPGNMKKRKHVDIFIDCTDDGELEVESDLRIFVPWAALSYYSRKNNVPTDLLKTTRDFVGTRKVLFCDFLYTTDEKVVTDNPVSSDRLSGTGLGKTVRRDFLRILTELKEVAVPDKTWKRWTSYQYDDAVEINKPFTFSIAFENQLAGGWVTEKIVNAFLAGCIPIYWGTTDVLKYFNKDAFIFASDFSSFDELAQYVVEVSKSEQQLSRYLDAPICTKENFSELFPWIPTP